MSAGSLFLGSVVITIAPVLAGFLAYVAYPAILWVTVRLRGRSDAECEYGSDWPAITITVPAYNAASSIGATLDRVLDLDYPKEKIQILVLSDASSDATDDIVRGFASRGVELLRAPARLGKTAGENAAASVARGEIIVNIDATVSVPRTSLKPLIQAFADPHVGVASGRDFSLGSANRAQSKGESTYTDFEMWLRQLETQLGSIVGASGCFYAIRRTIRDEPLPPNLSWDFAAALVAAKRGYRSVSVEEAVCIVPSTKELRVELRRKARTMARGLRTLFYFRRMLNPFQYGAFALMLLGHKLLRWLPYLLAPFSVVALVALSLQNAAAAVVLAALAIGLIVGVIGVTATRPLPRPVSLVAFLVAALSGGILAWWDALRGSGLITWDPTPRSNPTPG